MSERRRLRSVLGAIAFLALILAGTLGHFTPAFADTCSSNPDVQTTGDACSSTLAVSVEGNASGDGQCAGPVSCIAISGTGDASNAAGGDCGTGFVLAVEPAGVGCLAVSGAGNASNSAGGGCGWGGGGVGAACVAVSGAGSASNYARTDCGFGSAGAGVGCVAVSGTGNASNFAGNRCGYGGVGVGLLGCVAVSGGGQASNTTGNGCAAGFAGAGAGCIAVAGMGDASNTTGYCGSMGVDTVNPLGNNIGVGCVAVSVLGLASNSGPCGNHCIAICQTCPPPTSASDHRGSLPLRSPVVALLGAGLLAFALHPLRVLLTVLMS
jgi:hypothetical protein